ncbi:hypothetical protein [Halomicrobium salinisoli]|uniref:hypothetical protein n=1 Tax=Halomicrobium salinisoli TaxID=2878391 RepID=UPI001CF099F2|nr:hypothetical protein [Halomicrobium salinisoli]
MKKALRTLLALVVAAAMVGGGFAGTAAAQETITDTDGLEVNANVLNPVTSAAVNAINVGGDQTATSDVKADYSAGDTFVIE